MPNYTTPKVNSSKNKDFFPYTLEYKVLCAKQCTNNSYKNVIIIVIKKHLNKEHYSMYMRVHSLLFILLLILFQGCSTKQTVSPSKETIKIDAETQQLEEEDTENFDEEYVEESDKPLSDPLSGYNRMMTSFNDTLFIYLINPLSKGYATVLPEALRLGIANFIHNIEFPIRFANNLLQGKFQNSSDEIERFIVNTTAGVAGIFDPASTYMHIPAHHEDFGQTLGYYGVGAGYHVVLPLLGPSNIRDIIGLVGDGYASPLIYDRTLKEIRIPKDYLQSAGIYSVKMINKNALNLGAYESLKKDSIDLYPFLRDIYEQKRTNDIEN